MGFIVGKQVRKPAEVKQKGKGVYVKVGTETPVKSDVELQEEATSVGLGQEVEVSSVVEKKPGRRKKGSKK